MGLMDFISGGQTGQSGLGGVINRFTNPTNPLGQFGKALSQASGGGIGDALTLMDQQKRQQQQDAMQQQIQQAQLAAITAKQNRNQIMQGPNGAIFSVDPDTNAYEQIRAPEAPITADPMPVQIARAAGLKPGTPEWNKALIAAIPGYANTEPVLAQKNAYTVGQISKRTAGSMALRGTPTYGQAHPAAAGANASPPAMSTADLLAALGKK